MQALLVDPRYSVSAIVRDGDGEEIFLKFCRLTCVFVGDLIEFIRISFLGECLLHGRHAALVLGVGTRAPSSLGAGENGQHGHLRSLVGQEDVWPMVLALLFVLRLVFLLGVSWLGLSPREFV